MGPVNLLHASVQSSKLMKESLFFFSRNFSKGDISRKELCCSGAMSGDGPRKLVTRFGAIQQVNERKFVFFVSSLSKQKL